MQLIIAEFCGRWGCTWQEGILTVLFATFFKPIIAFISTLVLGAVGLFIGSVRASFSTPTNQPQNDSVELPDTTERD